MKFNLIYRDVLKNIGPILFLMYIMSFERVIGLPTLSVLMTLNISTRFHETGKLVFGSIAGCFLAIFYGVPFLAGILLLTGLIFWQDHESTWLPQRQLRMILGVLVTLVSIWFLTKLHFTVLSLVYHFGLLFFLMLAWGIWSQWLQRLPKQLQIGRRLLRE
jgi:hypothetical protein